MLALVDREALIFGRCTAAASQAMLNGNAMRDAGRDEPYASRVTPRATRSASPPTKRAVREHQCATLSALVRERGYPTLCTTHSDAMQMCAPHHLEQQRFSNARFCLDNPQRVQASSENATHAEDALAMHTNKQPITCR